MSPCPILGLDDPGVGIEAEFLGEPFLHREQPRLVGIGPDADHEPIAQRGGVSDDVEMDLGAWEPPAPRSTDERFE